MSEPHAAGAVKILVGDTADDVARLGASIVATALRAALDARGGATIALSGGDTPRPLYERLAAAHRDDVDWARVTVVYGDDRCVPPDHELSNHRMAHGALLAHVPVADERVHRVRGELPPADAAADYERTLRLALADRGSDAPLLDVNLMGIGPDGHTASLFPHAPALAERARWAIDVPAPAHVEPHVPRVTMTLPLLVSAGLVLFVATDGGKRDALRAALKAPPSSATPASLVAPGGRTLWLLDARAAAELDDASASDAG